jgi:hypothetical protein
MDSVISDQNGVEWNTPQTPLIQVVRTIGIDGIAAWNSITVDGITVHWTVGTNYRACSHD